MNNTIHNWQISFGKIVDQNNKTICGLPKRENNDAAHLIASAPDLLDALQVCIDSFEEMIGISDFGSPTESDFPLKQAREAIRKAKGEA